MYVHVMSLDVGYDVLNRVLELHFSLNGHVWQLYNVPEVVWYEIRKSGLAQLAVIADIIGIYPAKRIV